MKYLLTLALVCATSLHAATQISWKRIQLHGDFYSEGAGIGDINGDGKPDIVAGPFWWEGPAFEKKHAYYEPKIFSINGYSDNFFAYVHDFNGDKKNDILILGFPGKEARLYLNPGAFSSDTPWNMHIVADVVDNESPVFTDITGDGKPEIVCSTGGKFGWYAPNWEKPTEKWPFVAISDDMKVAKFTHGLGVGDVNGDGKLDLLEARRWWEQGAGAASPPAASEKGQAAPSPWQQHNFAAGVGGGAQMFAYDFDGNGTNDVATTLRAHDYGVAVYLQNKPSDDPNATHWTKRLIAGEHPSDTDYGVVFSQPHAMHLADINGDGVMDLVTGKRYWAHNGHGPDEHTPLALYWYETKRDGKGGVDFVPHQIDTEKGVGVGTDVQVGDVNGDGLPDIVVGNKAGVFVMLQERKEISATDAQIMEPKKMYGPALKSQADYAHGLSPQDALKAMQLPGGFKADLIVAEPDIVQPIAFCWDERGRIWVLEGLSYPQPREPGKGQDRIVILEDKDGDGTFETKKVFCEGISLGSGIEVGFGGVWVGAAPYLMFIPKGENDRPLERTEATEGTKRTLSDKSLPSLESFSSFTKAPGLPFTAYALLDGWGSQDTHETLNSFIWGPDGWLYGCHGVFTHSKVGKPGTPDDQRTAIDAGVWRYHPVRHVFEIFAEGTSNPWGLDYDENGEFFVTACVIPHLYHIVPGGRYQRQAGPHLNPYTYEDIKTIADHAHFAGNPRPDVTFDKTTGAGVMNNDTNSLGGGHAHCGLAIYQSSLFPQTYRNQLIFGNLHGHRIVSDYLEPHGSTYTGKHGSDFMRSNDMNFIPVTQKVGPDGALYVSDWSDKQVCHRGSGAVELWDRSNGRIYRVSYVTGASGPAEVGGNTARSALSANGAKGPDYIPRAPFDLAEESDESLAKLAVQTENEWFSRMARLILTERTSKDAEIVEKLVGWLKTADNPKKTRLDDLGEKGALRAQWLVDSMATSAANDVRVGYNSLPPPEPNEESPQARVVAVRSYQDVLAHLVLDQATRRRLENGDEWKKDLLPYVTLAAKDQSGVVRRELASMLQRIPALQRKDLATALLKHGEDKDDPYIPLLIWYGIEPVVGADAKLGLELAKASKMPKVTEFIYRRMGAEEAGRTSLLTLAAESKDAATRDALLNTVLLSARAGNKITMPEGWAAMKLQFVVRPSGRQEGDEERAKARTMNLITELEAFMGVAEAKAAFRAQLTNTALPANQREAALALLLNVRDADTAPLLVQLIKSDDKALTRRAVQALATLSHPDTAALLIEKFASFDATTKQDAINTLATSIAGAKAMLTSVKAKTIPTTMLSPFLARQIDALDNAEVKQLLKETFGDINAPKADLEERKKKFRPLLAQAVLAKADATKGHIIFNAICGQCHQLFGEGQKVGPDLTGSNRGTLEYILDNVLDPNAVIGKDYQLNIFELKDGRVASGVVKEESAAAFRIAMPGGLEQTITIGEVKKRTISKLSTMPEGLFDALPAEQLQQLVAYLQSSVVRPSGRADGAKNGLKPELRTVEGAIEGETLKVIEVKGGSAKLQGMAGFGGKWSSGQQLWWTGAKPGSTLTLALPVAAKGKYQLKAVLTKARDYGICDVALDGKAVATSFDGYNADKVILTDELDWGTHDLDAGDHKLTFTITGTNPQAVKSYMVGIDYVKLEKK